MEGLQVLQGVFALLIKSLELVLQLGGMPPFRFCLPLLADCPPPWLVRLALFGGVSWRGRWWLRSAPIVGASRGGRLLGLRLLVLRGSPVLYALAPSLLARFVWWYSFSLFDLARRRGRGWTG